MSKTPLHPQVTAFLEMAAEMGLPRLYELDPVAARAQVEQMEPVIGPGPEVATVEDIAIPVGDGEIPGRRYAPERSNATIVWFHGGGWVVAGLGSHDAMCRILANAAEATVVSVAYRLAPEHGFPGPLEDCWDALTWVAAQHPSVPLVVGGDSSGGNIAAVCAIRARDRGGPAIAQQLLVYPVTDHDLTTPSYVEHGGDDTLLGKKDMVWFWNHYVPDPADRANPEASPLQAADLSNLPPAVVVIAEYDPLRDEGLAYAERLRAAGTEVTLRRYDDMLHGFFSLVNVFQTGNETVEAVGADVRAAVAAAQPVG
jgi:acetyl esterase